MAEGLSSVFRLLPAIYDAGLSTSCTLLHGTRQHLRSDVVVEAAAEIPRTGGVRGGLDVDFRIIC